MMQSLRLFSFVGLLGLLATTEGRAQSRVYASAQVPPIGTAGSATSPAPVVYPDSVYINPEVRPQFAGGNQAFSTYLTKNIRYPQMALQRHVSGRVFVNFVLNAQGRVQDAHVVSGPGNGLNDEALRLVWLMPAWEPARVNGQPVRVACTVPISFTAER